MFYPDNNIVKNSEFKNGIANWSGSNAKRVIDPLHEGSFCVLLGNPKAIYNPKSVCILKQSIQGPFESEGETTLHYQLMHKYLLEPTGRLTITVTYLDKAGNRIQSTPSHINPNHSTLRWCSYTTIVPPAPINATSMTISFSLRGGMMYLGYVELTPNSHEDIFEQLFEEQREESIEDNQPPDDDEESIINYDAI